MGENYMHFSLLDVLGYQISALSTLERATNDPRAKRFRLFRERTLLPD